MPLPWLDFPTVGSHTRRMPTNREHLGVRIRRLRQERRLSQSDLADILGVSTKTVGNWERGETSPEGSLGAIEAYFGVDLETGQPRHDDVVAAIERSNLTRAQRAELIALYYRLLDAESA